MKKTMRLRHLLMSLSLCFALSSTALASGSNVISLFDCFDGACRDIAPDKLPKGTHYLGSTKHNHYFAHTMSSSGWRYVNAYRVSKMIWHDEKNGWRLKAEDLKLNIIPENCPRWYVNNNQLMISEWNKDEDQNLQTQCFRNQRF